MESVAALTASAFNEDVAGSSRPLFVGIHRAQYRMVVTRLEMAHLHGYVHDRRAVGHRVDELFCRGFRVVGRTRKESGHAPPGGRWLSFPDPDGSAWGATADSSQGGSLATLV
jgi:hypothetical protein